MKQKLRKCNGHFIRIEVLYVEVFSPRFKYWKYWNKLPSLTGWTGPEAISVKNVCTPATPYGTVQWGQFKHLNTLPASLCEKKTWLQFGYEPLGTWEADIKTGFNPPLGWMIQSAGTSLSISVSATSVCLCVQGSQWVSGSLAALSVECNV